MEGQSYKYIMGHKSVLKKTAYDANLELSEVEEDDDDIIPILMNKCKMTEEEVILLFDLIILILILFNLHY